MSKQVFDDVFDEILFLIRILVRSVAHLLYALSSNPLVTQMMGFKHGVGLGPFTFLPDIFTAAAVVILLYMSYD